MQGSKLIGCICNMNQSACAKSFNKNLTEQLWDEQDQQARPHHPSSESDLTDTHILHLDLGNKSWLPLFTNAGPRFSSLTLYFKSVPCKGPDTSVGESYF